MELFLNLTGALVGVAMVCFWLRLAPREGSSRQLQVVALALLILILFPVISVTDDLLAAQNPAETASCARRDHMVSSVHSVFPVAAATMEPEVAETSGGCLLLAAPGALPAIAKNSPALDPVENRPPPTA
jgi:hypothetical protein